MPSGDGTGWNSSGSPERTTVSTKPVARWNSSSSSGCASVARTTSQDACPASSRGRSAAYQSDFPSGAQATERSWEGVVVTRFVVPCSTEATNTSPRTTNATSSPSGETARSSAPFFSTVLRTGFRRSSARARITTRFGSPPSRST